MAKKPRKAPEPPSLRTLFGRRVAALRRAAGLTQEDAADTFGLARAHYGKVECGHMNATLDTIEKIAAGLNVSVADLFNFGPEEGALT